jgi:hypothetical protein
VPFDFDFVIEVALQAVFESDFGAFFRIFRDGDLEQPLSNDAMIVVDFFASVVYIHLQREQGQGQFVGNEAERLGHILLRHPSSIRPAAVGKRILQVTSLERISRRQGRKARSFTMSVVMSLPVRSMLTQKRKMVARVFVAASGNSTDRIDSKLSSLANMAKSNESR